MEKSVWWKTPKAQRFGMISLIAICAGLIVWLFLFFPYVSTDDARVAATLVKVAPEGVSGRVIKVNVQEGDEAKKDQVLVELDHTVTEARLKKAKASDELAERELKRVQQLVRGNASPPRELDIAQAKAEDAAAEVQLSQHMWESTFLRSPINGIVIQKSVEEGNILDPGQVAVTVADLPNAWVAANIEETSVNLVKRGQPVEIKIDEGGSLSGTVEEIRQATAAQFSLIPSDSGSGNFTKVVQRIPIKIHLAKHRERLRVGQSVVLKIKVRL